MKIAPVAAAAALLAFPVASQASAQAGPSGTQKTQQQMMNDVPHCPRKLGTVSVANGDDPSGWTQFQLAGPERLIKVLVQRSGCFNLVDRGAGLNAAERERDIGGNLGLQRGSNVGQGQVKAADYVLVAEVQAANRNSGGNAIGAGLGGLIGDASAPLPAESAARKWKPTPS
jgi:curli biogenesis system outer membrane secretion channel CsgG